MSSIPIKIKRQIGNDYHKTKIIVFFIMQFKKTKIFYQGYCSFFVFVVGLKKGLLVRMEKRVCNLGRLSMDTAGQMLLGMMGTRLAWMAHRLPSSNRDSRVLEAKISLEVLGNLTSQLLKETLRMRSSVDFWYLLISLRVTVPGLYLWDSSSSRADLWADLWADESLSLLRHSVSSPTFCSCSISSVP
jgi:hypothetical protein